MKNIFLSLIAIMATMSINAQVVRVYDNGTLTDTYINGSANTVMVVFEEAPSHEYVEIGGLKWATMNLGATTVAGDPATCYGDYYAWGETEPRYTSMSITSDNTATFGGWNTNHSRGYYENDYPSYTETTLDEDHDAVTQAWGGDWRTPTNADFQKLIKACTGSDSEPSISSLSTSTPKGGIYWLSTSQTYLSDYSGVAGVLFVDKTDTSKRVFFPAAGLCSDRSLVGGSTRGHYWSSSIYTNNTNGAYRLFYSQTSINPSSNGNRYYGFPIRPVSE